jgi:hypothetical protein
MWIFEEMWNCLWRTHVWQNSFCVHKIKRYVYMAWFSTWFSFDFHLKRQFQQHASSVNRKIRSHFRQNVVLKSICSLFSFERKALLCHVNTRVMVFKATFNNISVISLSVLLVEETRVPWENQLLATSHWQTSSHNILSSTPCHEQDFNSQR